MEEHAKPGPRSYPPDFAQLPSFRGRDLVITVSFAVGPQEANRKKEDLPLKGYSVTNAEKRKNGSEMVAPGPKF
jgi:hypothetical protein